MTKKLNIPSSDRPDYRPIAGMDVITVCQEMFELVQTIEDKDRFTRNNVLIKAIYTIQEDFADSMPNLRYVSEMTLCYTAACNLWQVWFCEYEEVYDRSKYLQHIHAFIQLWNEIGNWFQQRISLTPDEKLHSEEQDQVIQLYRRRIMRGLTLYRRLVKQKRQDWLSSQYGELLSSIIRDHSENVGWHVSCSDKGSVVYWRTNCYLLGELLDCLQCLEAYIFTEDYEDRGQESIRQRMAKNRRGFRLLFMQIWDTSTSIGCRVYTDHDKTQFAHFCARQHIEWFQEIIQVYAKQDEQLEATDDLWVALHAIQSLSEICQNFHEFSSNSVSITVDEAKDRKQSAMKLYQQWFEWRQQSNNKTVSTVKNMCYDTMKSLAKSLYISDDIPQCKQEETCHLWLNMLSQQLPTIPDGPFADVELATTNLAFIHRLAAWHALGIHLSALQVDCDKTPDCLYIEMKIKNLEWIQSRNKAAEKQLSELMNKLAAKSNEDLWKWLLSVSCDANMNDDEELLTAQREIQNTEEALQLATWNQSQLQMMKPLPTDSVSALLLI
jgi:hypothetical protein